MASLILSTVSKMEDAQRIAEILVTERLAACVNIIGSVNSVYRWRDKIERNQEIMLVIKTSRERSKSAMYRLTEIHPYEVPEAIALETSDGSSKYLKWIEDSTVIR
ncbi:MAG: divalent-cation tolerance protein CutA [Candidatus Thermoplasmatota archaeon]|jgi:periplasmic divalent cation tolerance protein|nr:divalent-cation tolerance protein CutA [Candidatus Thermoplasmatota archaeon]